MSAFLQPFYPLTYVRLRIVTGFLFLWHGTQKLFGVSLAAPTQLPDFVIVIGGSLELIGG